MFTYDTTLYVDNCDKVFLYSIIQNELLNKHKWFISIRFNFNSNKICYIYIYMLFNNKLSHINISINNINLTSVKSIEFVGIIIDQNLYLKLHILYLKNNLDN